MVMKLLLSFIVVCGLMTVVPAQRRGVRLKQRDVRILRNRPTLYISFVRYGKLEPVQAGENGERVWLRLHNNTRWSISLLASDAPKGTGDANLHYEVEPNPRPPAVLAPPVVVAPGRVIEKQEAVAAPCDLTVSELCHSCTVIKLTPGSSLLFSVPRGHLCWNAILRVIFSYEWEGNAVDVLSGDLEPQHSVAISGFRLPKEAR